MAITGDIRNDKTVAKSTSSFKLFLNWRMITSDPADNTNKTKWTIKNLGNLKTDKDILTK